ENARSRPRSRSGVTAFAGIIGARLRPSETDTMQEEFIRQLFSNPDMLRMGHFQRLDDFNLGLGWMYYALGRIIRPSTAVVIGSYRGFAPSVIAKSLSDNTEGGEVVFIDPSY